MTKPSAKTRQAASAPVKAGGRKPPQSDAKSAARALELLGLFAASRRALSLTEITERLGAPKSSCYQLVRTLQYAGYLYALGPRRGFYPTKLIVYQAQTIAQHDPIRQLIEPQLLQLRDRTNESVVVSSLHEGLALIIDLLESPQGIRFGARIGERRPLHSSSIGRALLGAMSPEKRDELLSKQESDYPDARPIDRKALEKELAQSAKRGWYVSKNEPLEGVTAVAIPLTVAGSRLAVAVAGPSARMTPDIARHAAILVDCFSPWAVQA